MQLLKSFSGPKASTNYIQLSHRRDAVAYAVAGLAKIREANLDLLGRDAFNAEMEDTMRAWVEETLYQGAYLREYHLWEKDCKEYFAEKAARNGSVWPGRPRGNEPFTRYVEQTIRSYKIEMPAETIKALDRMRDRVNVMKHAAGLLTEHFITEDDYVAAMKAQEDFWEFLDQNEKFRP